MAIRFRRAFARLLLPRVLPALAALALAACDDDPAAPAAPDGAYEATAWTGIESGTTTDILAAGGVFDIVLTAQGTTTGRLFIPGSVTGEGDFDSNLAGTWTQTGSVIEFHHAADTFVRDMAFTVQGFNLVGDRTFGDLRIRVTLTRLPVALR